MVRLKPDTTDTWRARSVRLQADRDPRSVRLQADREPIVSASYEADSDPVAATNTGKRSPASASVG